LPLCSTPIERRKVECEVELLSFSGADRRAHDLPSLLFWGSRDIGLLELDGSSVIGVTTDMVSPFGQDTPDLRTPEHITYCPVVGSR
jgi:hypothetical protein